MRYEALVLSEAGEKIAKGANEAATLAKFEYAQATGNQKRSEELADATVAAADRSTKRVVETAQALPAGDLIASGVAKAEDKLGITDHNYSDLGKVGGNITVTAVSNIASGKGGGADAMALGMQALSIIPGGGGAAAVEKMVGKEAVAMVEKAAEKEIVQVAEKTVEQVAEKTLVATAKELGTDLVKDRAKSVVIDPAKDKVKETLQEVAQNATGRERAMENEAVKPRAPGGNPMFDAMLAADKANNNGKGYSLGTGQQEASIQNVKLQAIAAAAPVRDNTQVIT